MAATGGAGHISALALLRARSYGDIQDRKQDLAAVRRELQAVIDAIPTQIHPDEREAYLKAIMDDLEDREGAVWTQWPDDVYLLALTAIRILARNPMGSTTLLAPSHMTTLLHHTALPLPPSASPFSHPPSAPSDPPALEALKVFANLLVLHPSAREGLAKLGGARALALALAGKGDDGQLLADHADDDKERMFLLGRLAFLVAVEKGEVVRTMVDKEGLVDSLCYHLVRLAPVEANYMALTELLKVTMNAIRYYPEADAGWNTSLDPLLQPLLNLFHIIPSTILAPPLSTTLHALLSVPFSAHLLPIWHSVPEPPSPSSSTSSVRSLIHKISHLGSSSTPDKRKRKSVASRAGSSSSAHSEDTGLGLQGHSRSGSSRSARSKSPSPPLFESAVRPNTRSARVIPTTTDPAAFPIRVLKVLNGWFEVYMPHALKADQIDGKVMVEDVLPPVLLLIARAAEGSAEFRKVFRDELLPSDLDRTPAAGPLETRRGPLGCILRLMHSSFHFTTRESAGELLWHVCDGDAATMTAEIGYGNAAGYLFQKGITAPPPGKIDDIPAPPNTDDTRASTSTSTTTAHRPPAQEPRHPISSLSEPLPQTSDIPMTPEEKECEAERLFVLFERMEKNPLISLTPDDGTAGKGREDPGEGSKKGVREMMRDKLSSGAGEEWERRDEEDARRREEEEERADDEEVKREMERYRKRMGK